MLDFLRAWRRNDFLNYFSSVFNLLNVAIGSGIIGLGSVAASMGYVAYVAFNIVVVMISIFTLNLVCKSATRVYKWQFDQREEIDFDDSRNDNIITEDEKKRLELNQKQNIRDTYQIAYSYEDIANILFGKWCLVANNLCILFYLFSCQCSYMTLIKDTFPQIIAHIGRMSDPSFAVDDYWYFRGEFCLLWVLLFILFPLGCAKRIDFLGFTSAIGMFAMSTFVFVIIAKQPDVSAQCGNITYPTNHSGFDHDIETECFMRPLNLSTDSIYAAGICLFAYMSHCNVLAIFAEVRTRSLERMRGVVYGAIIPCTVLYILAAMYAYGSFYNHTQAQLIELYSFIASGGNLIMISNILVMTCIVFSIPLAQYPARNTIWKLIYTVLPNHFPSPFLPSELDEKERSRSFPWIPFYSIMICSYLFIYYVVVSAANFKLFLALSGAVSGSTVIMIFPAMFHLKIENWTCRTVENFCAYLIFAVGFITLFGNSGMIILKEFFQSS